MSTYTHQMLIDFAFFLIALGICALFAFIETSITAMRLFKLKELEHTTKKYKSFFAYLEQSPQYVLITILIATNMAGITAAVISQNIIENLFANYNLPQGIGFTVGIAVATIVVSVIGEIIPKSIAQA